ncbi:mannose-P-dolichol utilization defect 1 protein-like [Lingula anatina]|uniref:Mannose-P-dolichol utilization defect 1 protein homolog n=1 Tax=Lingula anatina TaxID=7574 RepID=A0A1S3K302_LINAN|nr:mannose-P-dolichol utilization defect 1 protein-like [Lingula anatina]|eukprot:XP_013417013.1 mannose-P-dolichol utilization defect 1 protein-like [Lingula anatina]
MAFAQLLAGWVQLLVPQPCFDKFFVDFDFFDVPCLKIVISKCLGYGIILGSVLVKVPQIVKIISARSGEGISMPSTVLELTAVIASAAYGYANKFPFSAYGEGIFMMIQTLLVGCLVLHFSGNTGGALGFFLIVSGIVGFLMSPAAPLSLLWALQASNMPIVALSKMIQALENFKNQSTGQLSAITIYLLFLGSVARIFTSIQETGDNIVILTFVVSTICNGILALQIVLYWNAEKKPKKE